ncbi:2306_t:CDS:2 [Gigaspora margarita]|uniref:2306_t:CDS:1 n=1 Tax=Gigaspora margarita TaxID=4874 RepID=A0ABN7V4L3_GIGMA|nr:2306_t:CDS:2 [Gigaspora margarita]
MAKFLKEKLQQNIYIPINNHLRADVRSTEEVVEVVQSTEEGQISKTKVEVSAISEQTCILIPSYAYRIKNEKGEEEWKVYVRGWAYNSNSQSRKQKLLIGVARRVAGVNNDETKSKILEDRFGMFLAKNLRNQQYDVHIEGLDLGDNGFSQNYPQHHNSHTPSTHITSDTGHFSGTIRIPAKTIDQWIANANENNNKPVRWLKLSAVPEGGTDADRSYGFANLIDTYGISIISDIDDTIKHTGVNSGPRAALSSTFLYDQKEVSGMAEVYKEWYDQGASIHYVSNSPWQLFPMLEQFFNTKEFPRGSAHLKLYNDLKSIMEEPGYTKRQYIKQIFMDFPHRKFILIGDTTEFPDQILYIFIRDVSTERLKARPPPPKRTRSFPLFTSPRPTLLQLPSKIPKSMPTVIDTNSVEDNSVVNNSFVDHSGNGMLSPLEYDDSTLTPTTPQSPPTPLTPTTPGIDPLQEFQERVNKCRQKVLGGTFELFTDSQVLKVLKENDVIKEEFLKLKKRLKSQK